MEITKEVKKQILLRTIFLALVCLAVGAFGGYYLAMVEVAAMNK